MINNENRHKLHQCSFISRPVLERKDLFRRIKPHQYEKKDTNMEEEGGGGGGKKWPLSREQEAAGDSGTCGLNNQEPLISTRPLV